MAMKKAILTLFLIASRFILFFNSLCIFSHIFWFGDLNYRVDMDEVEAKRHVLEGDIDTLFEFDQVFRIT